MPKVCFENLNGDNICLSCNKKRLKFNYRMYFILVFLSWLIGLVFSTDTIILVPLMFMFIILGGLNFRWYSKIPKIVPSA